jgi:hypothetical protein
VQPVRHAGVPACDLGLCLGAVVDAFGLCGTRAFVSSCASYPPRAGSGAIDFGHVGEHSEVSEVEVDGGLGVELAQYVGGLVSTTKLMKSYGYD